MDWSLIIFVVVVMFFGYRGYRKGLLKSLSRVLSLLAGYAAAVLYTGHISTIIASIIPVQGIAALILASLFMFFAAGIAVSTLFLIVERLISEQEAGASASSYAGAAIGLFSGLVIAIIMVWTIAFIRDTRSLAVTETVATNQSSDIEILANQLASKTVNTAMSLGSVKPVVTRLSVALIENPAEVTLQAQRLARSNDINAFLSDAGNQAVLNSGDIEAVQNLPAFQQLVRNPDLIALVRSAGVPTDPATPGKSTEATIAEQITDIWGRVQRARSNQTVQEIISNPEFQQTIQSGNPVELLTDPKLLELAKIIFADEQSHGMD
ncbi:MAG: CvpA family protein [Gammaproteobacteria bacterium]|nr:CvpA family protein [Gammaproteobacteria bacterium]